MAHKIDWSKVSHGVLVAVAAAILSAVLVALWSYAFAPKDLLKEVSVYSGIDPDQGGVIVLRVDPYRQGGYEFIAWADGQETQIAKKELFYENDYLLFVQVPPGTKILSVGVKGPWRLAQRSRVDIPLK